jgi:hypothetical protein
MGKHRPGIPYSVGVAISHVCMGCGLDLARVRAAPDPHYGLPLVTCPRCAGLFALALAPIGLAGVFALLSFAGPSRQAWGGMYMSSDLAQRLIAPGVIALTLAFALPVARGLDGAALRTGGRAHVATGADARGAVAALGRVPSQGRAAHSVPGASGSGTR